MSAGVPTYPLILDDPTVGRATPGASVDAGLTALRTTGPTGDEFRRPPRYGDTTGPADLAARLRGSR